MAATKVISTIGNQFRKHPIRTGIIAVLIVLILILAIRKVINSAKRAGLDLLDIKNVPDGSRPKLSQAEIDSIAKTQMKAMDRFGTDEETLFASIEGLNGSDLRRVYKAFGVVPYSSTLGMGSALFSSELDLLGWYRTELDKEELANMQAIWDKAGIVVTGN